MTTYDPGTYRAEVTDQGFAESEAKSTPYFFVDVRILSRGGVGSRQGSCPRHERTLRQYLNTEVGQRILREDLRALGVEIADLAQLSAEHPDHISLVGRQIDVRCDHEDFGGKPRERWRIARPPAPRLGLDAIRALSRQAEIVPPPPAPPADES